MHYEPNETDIAARSRYFLGELMRELQLDHLPYFCSFASGCAGFISLLVVAGGLLSSSSEEGSTVCMEAAPERARHLLESVPVSFVIVDKLEFVDISRRYADPAVESDPGTWRVVQSMHGTKIYERGSAGQ